MASWLSSAIQNVRDKSMEAMEFVRRDLTEFTTTVKSDTETYLNKIKTQEVGDLGINRFVSKFNDSNKPDNQDEKQFQASASFDRVQSELTRIQNDESIYLNDPTPPEAYENWRETTNFSVDTRKGEIAQLLIDAPHVRSFYAHLVPAQTTHSDFWSRYYYRVHLIEEEEARRTQLIRRAHEMCTENSETTGKNNETDWDELDDDGTEAPPPPPPPPSAPVITENPIPIEHQDSPEQQQESIASETTTEKSSEERTESDTVSGDSWEREFDETDVLSSKVPVDPLTNSEETVTSDSLTSSTTTTTTTAPLPSSSSSSEKKGDNEFDDEWESWS